MDTTTLGGGGEPLAEDDDGPLAPDAEPEAIDEDGDDASPVCLRCFVPLLGAPTRCPSCGAPASLAATLGPSAGGGVDVGGTDSRTLPRARDGGLSPWAYALIWGAGLLVLPSLFLFLVTLPELIWSQRGIPSGTTVVVAVFGMPVVWTLVFVVLMLRARSRARRAPPAGPS